MRPGLPVQAGIPCCQDHRSRAPGQARIETAATQACRPCSEPAARSPQKSCITY